jgi:hypothetical protein
MKETIRIQTIQWENFPRSPACFLIPKAGMEGWGLN